VIYKSIADRLRLRLNSSDFNRQPAAREKKLAEEFGGAHDHPQSHRSAGDWGWWCVATARHLRGAQRRIMKPAI
jgi:hypothetical protein